MENKQFYYAGFWRRFVAYLIDELLVGAVTFTILLPLYLIFGFGVFAIDNLEQFEDFSTASTFTQYHNNDDFSFAVFAAVVVAIIVIVGISLVIQWLYFALMESSSKQATLGKMALGIRVVDMNGDRISFGRASGRYFGKFLSGLILNIGYIMAAFTEKKQALHDIIASCLVILDRAPYQSYSGGIHEDSQNITSA